MADFWTSNTMEPKRGFRFLIQWNIDGDIGYISPERGSPATSADSDNMTSKTITKSTATAAAAGLTIKEMGTADNSNEAVVQGEWRLKNAFITSVNFGEHSYDSEDMIDIQLDIQYDWANYKNLRS